MDTRRDEGPRDHRSRLLSVSFERVAGSALSSIRDFAVEGSLRKSRGLADVSLVGFQKRILGPCARNCCEAGEADGVDRAIAVALMWIKDGTLSEHHICLLPGVFSTYTDFTRNDVQFRSPERRLRMGID